MPFKKTQLDDLIWILIVFAIYIVMREEWSSYTFYQLDMMDIEFLLLILLIYKVGQLSELTKV